MVGLPARGLPPPLLRHQHCIVSAESPGTPRRTTAVHHPYVCVPHTRDGGREHTWKRGALPGDHFGVTIRSIHRRCAVGESGKSVRCSRGTVQTSMSELPTKLDLSSLDPKPREVSTAPSDPTLWEADPFYEAAEALQVRVEVSTSPFICGKR